MKRYLLVIAALLLALPLFSQANSEQLPIVGLNENNEAVAVDVPKGKYNQLFGKIITEMHDSTRPVLEAQKKRPGWMLRHVAIGVGVRATVGLGPLYHFSAKPRIRMIFSNSSKPFHY